MFIEFYNEKQAMDILDYATRKDYTFETGDAAWEVSYTQDIKEELDYQLYECNDDDPDVIHFKRYPEKEQKKIYDYVVNPLDTGVKTIRYSMFKKKFKLAVDVYSNILTI